MNNIVYATTNPGKFKEVSDLFAGHGIVIHAPSEFGLAIDTEETGDTLEANAILKAEAYLPHLPTGTIVVSDDTGLEIDALGGEPGIKVRRWKGYRMEDEEIISYCLERLQGVEKSKRTAHFRTVFAVAQIDHPTRTFVGKLDGLILAEPHAIRVPGLPFQPLFFATDYDLMLYQIHDLPMSEKIAKNITTHRERAVTAALPYLKTLNH